MMSPLLPLTPPPDPTGSQEPTHAENTEAFVAALAVALGLVPVVRPTPLPGAGLGLSKLQANADVGLTLDGEPTPAPGANALVPVLLDDAATGAGGQPSSQPARRRPDAAGTPAPFAAGALPPRGDGALEALTTPHPADDVDGTTAIRSVAESGNGGRFALPQDLVDAATKQAAELGTAQKTSVRPVGGAEKRQPDLSNGGAQTQGGSGERPSFAPAPVAQLGTTPMTRAVDVAVGNVAGLDATAEPAPAPTHQARVDVVDANGDRATIRVALRGETVRATIVHADGRVVEDLRANSADLRRALNEQGLAASRIRVQAAGASAVAGANDSPAGSNDARNEQREQSRQRDPQSGGDGREQRDAHPRSRRERER